MVAVTIIKKTNTKIEVQINPNFNLLIWFLNVEIVSWSLFLARSNPGMISIDLAHIGRSMKMKLEKDRTHGREFSIDFNCGNEIDFKLVLNWERS